MSLAPNLNLHIFSCTLPITCCYSLSHDCCDRSTEGQLLLLWCWLYTTHSMSERRMVGGVRRSIRVSERPWHSTGWDTGPEYGPRRRCLVFPMAGYRSVRAISWTG